jgi:hypothetical protein
MMSFSLRSKTWLQRSDLDRRLAGGAPAGESPKLAARASQLQSRRTRLRLAEAIERVVEAAEHPRPGFAASAPLCASEIRDNQSDLLLLAEDLASSDEVQPRGVAMVEELLTDGNSPIYRPSPEGTLREAARQARAALHLA